MGEVQDQGPQLVKCEISGREVPPDEIIEFQGYKVCAEGKDMLLKRLKSGEMLPGELERPSVLRRFGCYFVDGFLVGIVNLGITFALLGAAVVGTPGSPGDVESFVRMQGIASFLAVLIAIAYFGLMHGSKGQTLGKMAGKLKVVNMDGSDITMGKGFARAFLYLGPNLLQPLAMFVIGMTPGANPALGAAQFLALAAGIYLLANIILALVDRAMQRALHDRLAGTRVVVIS